MKVTILGTNGGYVSAGEANTSLLIENNDDRVIIDMGSGVLSNLERVCSLDKINNVVITHAHSDHFSDALVAVYGRLISKQLKREVQDLVFHGPDDSLLKEKLTLENVSSYSVIDEDTVLNIGSLKLTFYKTIHGVTCYAVKCEVDGKSVFYTSDTSYSEKLIKEAKGCDLLLCECSILKKYGSGSRIGHMNTAECAAFIKETKASKVRLVHLPCYLHYSIIENECGYECAKSLEEIII